MPDGTRITATLDTRLGMRTSRNGDAFTMTVRAPGEFRGARIAGVVSRVHGNRNDEASGDLGIDFQSIELRGDSSAFDGYLETVRLSDGSLLRVNAAGDVRGNGSLDSQVHNGAVGAALGAIIGAIAGGGKGAAVGAVVGGAGGVILTRGHEQLDLGRGTEVTLTAASPDGRR